MSSEYIVQLSLYITTLTVRCQENGDSMLNEYMRFLQMLNMTSNENNNSLNSHIIPFPPFLQPIPTADFNSTEPDYIPFMSVNGLKQIMNSSNNSDVTSTDLNTHNFGGSTNSENTSSSTKQSEQDLQKNLKFNNDHDKTHEGDYSKSERNLLMILINLYKCLEPYDISKHYMKRQSDFEIEDYNYRLGNEGNNYAQDNFYFDDMNEYDSPEVPLYLEPYPHRAQNRFQYPGLFGQKSSPPVYNPYNNIMKKVNTNYVPKPPLYREQKYPVSVKHFIN